MTKRSLWILAVLGAVYGIGIAYGETDRFVSSATGDDLGGLNDCRDSARPCKTIRQALARAGKGDTIKILPGPPYEECGLEIKQQVRIVSEGIQVIIGPDPEKRAIDAPKTGETDDPMCPYGSLFVLQISGEEAKGTTIERLSLRGRFSTKKTQEQPALLIVKDTSGVVIRENQFTIKKKDGDEKNTGVGLKLLNSSFKEISDNEIRGTREPVANAQGIILQGVLQEPGPGPSLEVKGNKIFGHGGEGILIENANLKPSLHLLQNTVERNAGHGVSANQVSGLTIEANQILNNEGNGIELFCKELACERITLRDNIITGSGRIDEKGNIIDGLGINLNGTAVRYNDMEISTNLIRSNRGAGIKLVGGKYLAKIENNRLEANQAGVIVAELQGGSSLELTKNNISMHKGDGLKIKLTNATGATKLIVRGNTTDQNSGSGLVLEGFNTTEGSEIKIEGLKSRGNKEGVVLKGAKGVKDQKITIIPSIRGSQLEGNRCAGLVLEGSSLITIENNTIVQNGQGCSTADRFQLEGAGIVLKGSSDKNSFHRNVLDRNLNGISLRELEEQQKEQYNDFQCNVISGSDHSGILVLPKDPKKSAPASFWQNNIVGNLGFGLRNLADTEAEIDVRNNWWGHPSGPAPQGKGDRILGPAHFKPWLTQAVDINRCP